jgi:hypothetical protein
MPSRFAITDSGSGRAGCGPRARACLYCCHSQSLRLLPGAFEPVEHLRRRVDLVVVLALGNTVSSCRYSGEPRRFFGQIDKAVLDHRGLGVHAHDLVRLRLVAGDRV